MSEEGITSGPVLPQYKAVVEVIPDGANIRLQLVQVGLENPRTMTCKQPKVSILPQIG